MAKMDHSRFIAVTLTSHNEHQSHGEASIHFHTTSVISVDAFQQI